MRVLHEVPFPPTAYGLVVSPDGRHVAFYQPALGSVPSMATVPEGATQNLPNEGNAGQAAWSPEGDYLAYLSTDEEQPERWMEVWLYSVGGERLVGRVRLEPQDIGSSQRGRVLGDAYPAWSRDGKELYYLTLAGVYRVDLREFAPTGTRRVQLRGRQVAKADAFPGELQWLARGPVAWDGGARLLAFCAEDGAEQVLWVVDRSGKVVARVPGPGIPAGWTGREVLSWCPDGERLAWVRAASAGEGDAGAGQGAAGAGGVNAGVGQGPAGVGQGAAAEACRVSVLDVESGRVTGLLGGLGDRLVRLHGWSPDGSRLALLVSPGAGEGWALWLVRVSEEAGEGTTPSRATAAEVWDGEKLREVRWLTPDRLLGLTVDDRLLVLQLGG